MTTSSRISLLLALAACNFPRPNHMGDDAATGDASTSVNVDSSVHVDSSIDAVMIDAPDLPGTVMRVSPSGDDANDGLTMPVRTLKHAIGLAAANREITRIVLASGRYSGASGETFPYTVPASVTIAGPAGGGAILAGTKAQPGILADSGGLQDIDLEDFTTAITATGTVDIRNIRVIGSTVGVQAETAAKLTVDNLDITGIAGSCATGVVLIGVAQFVATRFATRGLGASLDARDQSVINIGKASIAGDNMCNQSISDIVVTSAGSLVLNDSLIDGGGFQGVRMIPRASSLHVTITDTIIRNVNGDALSAGGPANGTMMLQVVGGELSNNRGQGAELSNATSIFTDVTIRQNIGIAIYLQDGNLIMRDCTIRANGGGVDVYDRGAADLGTTASPGNNILQTTSGVSLALDGSFGAMLVTAVGNTWNPNIQDADSNGHYTSPATITMPIPFMNGNNYGIFANWSLLR